MPLYINGRRIVPDSEYGILDFASKVKLSTLWQAIGPVLFSDLDADAAGRMALGPGAPGGYVELADMKHVTALNAIKQWMNAPQETRFTASADFLGSLCAKLGTAKIRTNYFYRQSGENENIAPVIYESLPPSDSIGWSQAEFFRDLGHERNAVGSIERNAEQEYLLQGMPKGAMKEAAGIAEKYNVGIAVRPTGVVAHIGIESGNPTKAQEFKNKTSKDVDFYLCDELGWDAIGAVVHYDPRVEWTSRKADAAATAGPLLDLGPPTEGQWLAKKTHIETARRRELEPMERARRISFPGLTALRDAFFSRAKEYREEDHEYRKGHYAPHCKLVGPYIRLKLRPEANMYGDHDLFGFTVEEGILTPDDRALGGVQKALQAANTFQAQHGGIWYWQPSAAFNVGIKNKIMEAHSPPDGDPLIYILPHYRVRAVFFIKGTNRLESVWDHREGWKWLNSTHSGKAVLNSETRFNEVTGDIADWLRDLTGG
jgi:hypothetical protein